jgi:ComF family protein
MDAPIFPEDETERAQAPVPIRTSVPSALIGWLGRQWALALDTVYPPTCLACNAATIDHDSLCARCWRQMPLIGPPVCERLGTPLLIQNQALALSLAAMSHPPLFERARAVSLYDGIARELVHRLKYGDQLQLARPMARWMAVAGKELIRDCDAIIPVPMHGLRLLQRRFNQAATLASALSDISGKPLITGALRRVKRTRPQPGLSRTERADNLQGAFKADGPEAFRLAGLRLLLVDDVQTTGATGNACTRALLRCGAKKVDLLCFACVAHDH